MKRALLRRRFGRGAARLPVGSPSVGGLFQHAESSAPFEKTVALAPTAFVVLLSALLLAAVLRQQAVLPAEDEPIRIQRWAEEQPAGSESIVEAKPPPRSSPAPERATPIDRPRPDAAQMASSEGAPAAAPRAIAQGAVLPMPAMAGLPEPLTEVRPTAAAVQRPIARPAERRGEPTLSVDLRMASAPDFAAARAPSDAHSTSGTARVTSDEARPESESTALPEAARSFAQTQERPSYMAEAAEKESLARVLAPVPAPLRGRRAPAVAAGLPQALREPARGATSSPSSGPFGAGWEEVPIDSLPDCSPPGRQDQLKQQILRRSAGRPVCAHPEGRYRFVETRNLGSFLMWTNSTPSAAHRDQAPRDACEVLEAALLCLKGEGLQGQNLQVDASNPIDPSHVLSTEESEFR